MSRNILLTSLSAAQSTPPVRYFSLRNEFGSDYCDALLDAEASIKSMLARYQIDDIFIFGGDGSFHEGEDLKTFPLQHGRTLYSADSSSLSTFGLLQTRIAQYADELTPAPEAEDGLPSRETQERLIRFIHDFQEGDDELKGKKFNRLFDALAQNGEAYGRFRDALSEKFPEMSDPSGSCAKWIKSYLYSELKPSGKLELLPVNEGTSLCLISEQEMIEGGNWVKSMMAMQDTILQNDEDFNLYVSLNSDDASDTFIVMTILDLLVSRPGKQVRLKKIFTVRGSAANFAGSIRDDTDGFGVTKLTHAIHAFLNYGKADMIVKLWEESGVHNESIAGMIYAMRHVDVGLSMCNLSEMEQGILRLRQLLRDEKLWRDFGNSGMLFSVIAKNILEDYGPLLQGDGDIPFIDLVKWAYRHQFYQQTLTLIESKAPDSLVQSGIFYYCNDENQVEEVTRQFAQRRLELRPQEFFKMDQIDHYFIKACDRAAVRARGIRSTDSQRAYADLRTQSLEGTDSTMIRGYTVCDHVETLNNALYAYYHIGEMRNKISHADADAMNESRLIVSESDESTALVRMKESIDFFIASYEKAMAEVQGKNPNVILITSAEVRTAADHMKFATRRNT